MIIEFSKDELEDCHLTYEKLDSESLKSKLAICRIIAETQKLSGESIKISEKTRVDILPDGDGGCLIVLDSRQKSKADTNLRIYESESLDPIMDFAKSIGDKDTRSSLYGKDGRYRLSLHSDAGEHLMCREFLDLWGEGEADLHRTVESFDCLISENALKILGGFGTKK